MLERRRAVSMATTDTTLTLVRLMATMERTGSPAASSSERGRGSMVPGGWEAGVGLMDGTVVRGTEMLAGVAPGAIAAADTTVAGAMPAADTRAATPVADFTAV